MNTSIWQDEAQLANMCLEEQLNSSSESSSPGFNFNSTSNLKKNLTATFDMEVPSDPSGSNNYVAASRGIGSNDQSSWARPPLPIGFTEYPNSRKSKKKFAVYLRIRPLFPRFSDEDMNSEVKGQSTIEILKPASDSKNQSSVPTTIRTYPPDLSNTYKMNQSAYAKEFKFDQVMGPGTSQENVYSTVAAPLIQDLFDSTDETSSSSRIRSNSALLFSYGITNAGKTHTILGDMNSTNQANWGIIPRAIYEIFQRNRIHSVSTDSASFNSNKRGRNQPTSRNLYISFFEIYNENVFDLMPSNKLGTSKNVSTSPPALKVRECRGQIFVRGLAKHKVDSIQQGIELTKKAHKKRHTSSNNLNSDSSRSHFVCQIQIVPSQQPQTSSSDGKLLAGKIAVKNESVESIMSGYSTDEEATVRSRIRTNTIWIVDLAGSERSKRTGVGGTRQKESSKINNSLMTLMRCLNAMNKHGKNGLNKNVMPFRDSKLTHLFMGHLLSASAARTAMMVNVNPSVDDFDETQHVLTYSRKAKLIEIDITEYGMKRKEIFGAEYDQNGRKKPRLGDIKPPSEDVISKKAKRNILSRIAKKLSPKKAFTKISNNRSDYSDEIQKLKKLLDEAKDKVNSLENDNLQLLEELDDKEEQIRNEVSVEMEKRLRETRTKLNAKYELLRSEMRGQISKTDVSVSINRAGSQLEELMDKIDECEKEMLRMSQEHQRTVSSLKHQIQELNSEKEIMAKEIDGDASKILSLQEALEKANAEIIRLKGPREAERREREKKNAPRDNDIVKSSKFKRNLRPRKPLGNSTNQTVGSRIFAMDLD